MTSISTRTLIQVTAAGVALAVLGTGTVAVFAASAASGSDEPAQATTGAATETRATVPLVITGGLETNPVDNGRPVRLIAAALDVPAKVFREAFSHVSPAPDFNPSPEREAANKAALLAVLAPYGVTNDRLDEVSNHYRIRPGETWPHREATGLAMIENGVVSSVRLTDAGYGYSSVPQVRVPGYPQVDVSLTLRKSTAFEANGSIASIVTSDASAVDARAVRGGKALRVDVDPDSASSSYRLKIQQRSNGQWRTVRATRTRGSQDRVVVRLPEGRYRVVVPAQHGLGSSISAPVRLRA
ncbi:MAG: hypothetical protein KDC39_15655 [Actinobacteria bacterium]|nr:hypothetical protein [Actinomycetota bacterium]